MTIDNASLVLIGISLFELGTICMQTLWMSEKCQMSLYVPWHEMTRKWQKWYILWSLFTYEFKSCVFYTTTNFRISILKWWCKWLFSRSTKSKTKSISSNWCTHFRCQSTQWVPALHSTGRVSQQQSGRKNVEKIFEIWNFYINFNFSFAILLPASSS
jgi:hypothetical protein